MTHIRCKIRVRGHLGSQWQAWFDGLAISSQEQGETLLSGILADEAALYGTLMKLRDLGLILLSVSRDTPETGKDPLLPGT